MNTVFEVIADFVAGLFVLGLILGIFVVGDYISDHITNQLGINPMVVVPYTILLLMAIGGIWWMGHEIRNDFGWRWLE